MWKIRVILLHASFTVMQTNFSFLPQQVDADHGNGNVDLITFGDDW